MTLLSTAIPSAPTTPLLGGRGDVIRFYSDPVGSMRSLYQRYGNVVKWARHKPEWIFIFDPDSYHSVLRDSDRFYNFLMMIPVPAGSSLQRLSTGLLSMNGPQHKQHRRLMMPVFHKKHIEGYRDDMVALTERMLERWSPGQTINLAKEMQELTQTIAGKTLFGLEPESGGERISDLITHWMELAFSSMVILMPFDRPGFGYRRLLALSDTIDRRFRALIDQKRGNSGDHKDIMSMLLQARDEEGQGLSEDEVIGQTSQVFAASHETTANALNWTLFLLSQHPAVLNDLIDELSGALGGAAPTLEQLGRLPLLERVLKESLRLLPPVSYGARISTGPFELGQHQLPANTRIFFGIYMTHRFPELYPEPQRFLPQRWETINPTLYEYLPFSAGPRTCIGVQFAQLELKLVLATILQRFRLDPVPGSSVDRHVRVTLAPKNGLAMQVSAAGRRAGRVEVRGNIHEMIDLGL